MLGGYQVENLEQVIERLQKELKELTEDNVRFLQKIRELNAELDDYFMDREILTHLVDDTTVEDDE